MDSSRKMVPAPIFFASVVALVVGLSACSAGDPAGTERGGAASPSPESLVPSGSPSPGASSTPGPQPTAAATDSAETAARYTAIGDWARTVLPVPTNGDTSVSHYGFSDGDNDAPTSVSVTSLAAGDYSVFVTCRGAGSATLRATSGDVGVLELAPACEGTAQRADMSTPAEGVSFTIDPEGAIDYALLVTGLGAGS